MTIVFDTVQFPVYYIEGLAADKPTPGPITISNVLRVYHETDTGITRVWNGNRWTRVSDFSGGSGGGMTLDLDFQLSTDISDFDAGIQTWTDLFANQTFVVLSGTSSIVLLVVGVLVVGVLASSVATRVVIDSAGTPLVIKLGGTGLTQGNALDGSSPVVIGSLSAGSHTIKLQAYANTGALLYCRAQSLPEVEHLRLQVVENA